MTTDTHTRKYTCPKCDHVHAADLSAMEGHPEVHGKVHCMGCHELLWLSMDEEGLTQCELFKKHVHEVLETKGSGAAPAAAASAPAMTGSGSSGFGSVVLAAIVAAAVSFFVTRAASGSSAPATDEKAKVDTTAIEEQLASLKGHFDQATQDARGARTSLASAQADLQAAVRRNAELIAAVPAAAPSAASEEVAALAAKVDTLVAEQADLMGRIEAYYQTLRVLKKRVEAGNGN